MRPYLAIADMRSGDETEGFYVLSRAEVKKTAAGKNYLTARLTDCTGGIAAVMWDFLGSVREEDVGQIVKVRGAANVYNGALQLTVSAFRFAMPQDQYELSRLVPTAPIDVEERMEEIHGLVRSIADEDYRAVCEEMLKRHAESFPQIPAAKSVHHAFLSGLLMHSSNMLRTADFLANLYEGIVDRSLLLAGTLLHDMNKEREFAFSALGLVREYTVKGDLLGHLVMGAQEIACVAQELGIPEEKSVLLQHMLLSHHGQPELGAAVVPRCAESELLSLIDMMDARMEIYREVLETTPAGAFSERIYALEKRIYNHGGQEEMG